MTEQERVESGIPDDYKEIQKRLFDAVENWSPETCFAVALIGELLGANDDNIRNLAHDVCEKVVGKMSRKNEFLYGVYNTMAIHDTILKHD